MLIVGLTGNIGMGKSTVLKAFAELGAATIDTDKVVAKLLAMPKVIERVSAMLGPRVLNDDGSISKRAVAAVIFSDDEVRERYEAMIHPLVFQYIDQMLQQAKGDIVVIEVPMLYESGHAQRFHKIVTVYSDENVAIDRLEMAGKDKAEIVARLNCQMPIQEKVKLANYTVDNNGDSNVMHAQVKQIYRALKAEAQA